METNIRQELYHLINQHGLKISFSSMKQVSKNRFLLELKDGHVRIESRIFSRLRKMEVIHSPFGSFIVLEKDASRIPHKFLIKKLGKASLPKWKNIEFTIQPNRMTDSVSIQTIISHIEVLYKKKGRL